MSYDFDLRLSPCDHSQKRERMEVAQDFRTLIYGDTQHYMRAPVSSEASVKLFIDGTEIPRNHETYGWDLFPDETSVPPERRLKVMFRFPFRLHDAPIEISYACIPAYCLKCNGYQKTHDFKIEQTGTFRHISEYEKLLLRVQKFLLTSRCNFYPAYTSRLKDFVGQKFGLSLSEEDVTYECVTSLDSLKTIQQAQRSVQSLAPQEVLKDVESIDVSRDQVDPSLVKTSILVSSFGEPRPKPFTFAIRTNKG